MKKRIQFTALEFQVLRTIRATRMLARGDHVLAAVSGGADSTALLLCLHELSPRLGLRLTVAHLNHGLRGTEADEDEDFVRRACAALGVPFVSESADVAALAARAGSNLEEAAREARYEFLERAAARAGAGKIATGHNLDDQAETILMRLLRGSGLGGLSGMQPVAGSVVRPLLECSRRQILEFLAARHTAYREDSTNRDLGYQRNRLRRELIPYLEEHFNPRLAETLTREAAITGEAAGFLEDQARRAYAGLQRPLEDGIALPAQELLRLHPALGREIVRLALRELLGSLRGIESAHIAGILRLCGPGRSGRQLELPSGARARRDLEILRLWQGPAGGTAYSYELRWPGTCRVPEAGLEFRTTIHETPEPARQPIDPEYFALIDAGRVPAVLTVRTRLPGDHYGGAGHRKVKKMLLTARIPVPERDSLPVVAVGNTVIWIPGFRPAKFYGAARDSGRCVLLECRKITNA